MMDGISICPICDKEYSVTDAVSMPMFDWEVMVSRDVDVCPNCYADIVYWATNGIEVEHGQ